MDFIYFLGRFHVLALHLPIGILVAVVSLEWLSRSQRYRHLAPAAPYLWGLASISAVGTATLGYMHFAEGGFDGPAAFKHRLFGTCVAVVATLIWILRTRFPQSSGNMQILSGVFILALVTITGHYGGNLTHGDTYLTARAPGFLRSLLGLAPQRPPLTSLAMANPYLDVVAPMLKERCGGCHNEDKRRGGLSVATFTALRKGGKDGAVIVPGNPGGSDLIRRVSLPHDAKDAMPAEGKTPLTADQVDILRWWIESGAREDVVLKDATLAPHVRSILTAALGLGDSGKADAASLMSRPEVHADSAALATLVQAGFEVRQLSRSDSTLQVSAIGIHAVGENQMKALLSAQRQIVGLSLRDSGLHDTQMSTIGAMTALTRLDLGGNALTDAGIQQLHGLGKLSYLSVHDNKQITDASIAILAKLPALKRLYLWNTGITPAAAHQFAKDHPGTLIDLGDEEAADTGPRSAAAPADKGKP